MTLTDLDALVARLNDAAYRFGDSYPVDAARQREAAAALVQMRDSEALARGKIAEQVIEIARLHDWYNIAIVEMRQRAERAEAEVARLTETTTHITWDAQGCRLVNGRLGHEHSAPTVNVQLSGDAEYWKDRAERAESRANELEQARESIEEFSHMKTDRIAALEAERDALLPGVSAVRRFSCFQTEDGVYEHAEGHHVEYKDYRAMQIARDDLQHDANRINCARWKAEAERDALKQDAERYRWLREEAYCWGRMKAHPDEQKEHVAIWTKNAVGDAEIDAAIDAAIAARSKI